MALAYRAFEEEVAELYRELNAEVQHDVNVAGRQVDVFAVQRTPDGTPVRTAVECKDYEGPVGVAEVTTACELLCALRSAGSCEATVLLTRNGLTSDAKTHCDVRRVRHLTLAELKNQVANFTPYLQHLISSYTEEEVGQRSSFISLPAETDSGTPIASIVDYIDDWLSGSGHMLTILGEYGSGKSTTCRHIASSLAQDYIRFSLNSRIPILIPLRQLSCVYSIRSYLTDLFLNQYPFKITSYELFERYNREGRFLLILDGFDEMCSGAEPANVFRCLDEVLSLLKGNTKLLLTCRSSFFRDRASLRPLKGQSDLHSYLHRHVSCEAVTLSGYTDEQIQYYMSRYYGDEWPTYYQYLDELTELRSLADRPILLNMIVHTLSTTEQIVHANVAHLFNQYTDIWIGRDDWRCQLRPEQRRALSQGLAMAWLSSGAQGIHEAELKDAVRACFPGIGLDTLTLERYRHEVQTCSFLQNNLAGLYRFSHRSFAEFLTAQYLVNELNAGRFEQLRPFATVDVLKFVADLMRLEDEQNLAPLWAASTRSDEVDEATRAAVIYVLARLDGDLSGYNMCGADFPSGVSLEHAQMAEADLQDIKAEDVSFRSSHLEKADLRTATCTDCSFEGAFLSGSTLAGAKFTRCDFFGAKLDAADFTGAHLEACCLTPEEAHEAFICSAQTSLADAVYALHATKSVGDLLADHKVATRAMDRLAAWDNWNDVPGITECERKLDAALKEISKEHVAHFSKGMKAIEKGLRDTDRRIRRLVDAGQLSSPQLSELKRAERDHESSKRKLRQQDRQRRIRLELLKNRLGRVTQSIARCVNVQREWERQVGQLTTVVRGAVFADSRGLSKSQEAWLAREGAILVRNQPRPA